MAGAIAESYGVPFAWVIGGIGSVLFVALITLFAPQFRKLQL